MRNILILFLFALLFSGCDSLKKRNIALYEKNLEASERKILPPEPTLARKRVDEVSYESIMDRDGMNDKERTLMNKIKKEDKRKSRARSKKVFGAFAPKN
jgi:hypothetical protein